MPSQLPKKLLLSLCLPPLLLAGAFGVTEGFLALIGEAPAPRNFDRVWEGDREWFLVSAAPPLDGTRFRSERFAVEAEPGTRRIVCLGGSTTFGHPFLPPAPFADWIAARLQHLLPDQRFEVLNLGSNAWNSEAILDLVRELPDARPDLLVLYCGHNEFLDRNLPQVRQPGMHRLRRLLQATRLGRVLDRQRGPVIGTTDFELRQKIKVHDAPYLEAGELADARARFERNLRSIARAARDMGAALVLCHPVADLRDTPVEFSSFSAATPPATREKFLSTLRDYQTRRIELERRSGSAAEAVPAAELSRCLADLEALEALDSGVQLLLYERGRCHLLAGEPERALPLFCEALERDGHPIRATREIHRALVRVALDFALPLADPRQAFAAAAADGIPGQDGLFVDYCHPDLRGHEIIADAVLRTLADAETLAPETAWQFAAEPSLDRYREEMGFSARAQAESFANRAIFAIGQSYMNPENRETLRTADSLFDLALNMDPDCALAYAGLGFLAALRGEADPAFVRFQTAWRLSPETLRRFRDNARTHPDVRSVFEQVGIEFRDDDLQPVRRTD